MNMKGDFSRVTFDPLKHFSSVLMQQGRVQLDADWNEHAAILLWQIRRLARGVIGEFGCAGSNAFKVIEKDKSSLQVSPGLAFVHGIAVENGAGVPVSMPAPPKAGSTFRVAESAALVNNPGGVAVANNPAGVPVNKPAPAPEGHPTDEVAPDWFVMLAVWERLITWRDDPSIREIALGDGIDTTVRSKVMWKIVVKSSSESVGSNDRPQMTAGLDGGGKSTDICNIPPDAGYRGATNHLYRIEIHNTPASVKDTVKFKWSRENASLVFPVLKVEGTSLFLDGVGRDDRLCLHPGDFLEFESTDISWTEALPLALVKIVDPDRMMVTVDQVPDSFKVGKDNLPAVRRWDHSQQNSGGLTAVTEGSAISIENGLNVTFSAGAAAACRRGDYWLIPARTGGVWKPPAFALDATRPHYSLVPLAGFSLSANGDIANLKDMRYVFDHLAKQV